MIVRYPLPCHRCRRLRCRPMGHHRRRLHRRVQPIHLVHRHRCRCSVAKHSHAPHGILCGWGRWRLAHARSSFGYWCAYSSRSCYSNCMAEDTSRRRSTMPRRACEPCRSVRQLHCPWPRPAAIPCASPSCTLSTNPAPRLESNSTFSTVHLRSNALTNTQVGETDRALIDDQPQRRRSRYSIPNIFMPGGNSPATRPKSVRYESTKFSAKEQPHVELSLGSGRMGADI